MGLWSAYPSGDHSRKVCYKRDNALSLHDRAPRRSGSYSSRLIGVGVDINEQYISDESQVSRGVLKTQINVFLFEVPKDRESRSTLTDK